MMNLAYVLLVLAQAQPAQPLPAYAVQPALQTAAGLSCEFEGYLRKRIDNCIQRYFLVTPESSPAILQVMRDRDKLPVRDPLVPWAGEFAGKFLTGAELVWRATRDAELRTATNEFAKALMACQAPDGYLGPFPAAARLTGQNWDVWGHYHVMLGLLLYLEDTGDTAALDVCRKMGDLLCATFGPGKPSLTCDGSGGQMNMAICHSLLMLYEKTGDDKYHALAMYVIEQAWNEEGAGKYLDAALAGKPVWEFPQHRWEALHDYQALPILYYLTCDATYRTAALRIWRSGLRGDRHNTGGVTSGEGFCGSPYKREAIETCCTVAWIAFGFDILRLTGDSRVADEIEWSTLNSALGAIPHSGRACAYNVPMDGARAYGIELPWQSPKAGPDLNCCAVNAYRPLGMLAQWALMQSPQGLFLNFYGAGRLTAQLPSGTLIELVEQTAYPADGQIRLLVKPASSEKFALNLRIPGWSRDTVVSVNGERVRPVQAGAYLRLERDWTPGDTVDISFDMRLRFWAGEQECAGRYSVYRGPLLYAYDGRFNDGNADELPTWNPATIRFESVPCNQALAPWVTGRLVSQSGEEIGVCDFSSAGQTGNHYRSWLPGTNLPPSPFHLLEPEDGAAGTVCRWEAKAGADHYTIVFVKEQDNGLGPLQVDVRGTEYAVQLPPGEYYWFVSAVNADGCTLAANGPWKIKVE